MAKRSNLYRATIRFLAGAHAYQRPRGPSLWLNPAVTDHVSWEASSGGQAPDTTQGRG